MLHCSLVSLSPWFILCFLPHHTDFFTTFPVVVMLDCHFGTSSTPGRFVAVSRSWYALVGQSSGPVWKLSSSIPATDCVCGFRLPHWDLLLLLQKVSKTCHTVGCDAEPSGCRIAVMTQPSSGPVLLGAVQTDSAEHFLPKEQCSVCLCSSLERLACERESFYWALKIS